MATSTQVQNFKNRFPNLPSSVTDSVIGQYLDDAALEFEHIGIETTASVYDKALSLYAAHLMTLAGLIKQLQSSSVKDVSASYNIANLRPGETIFYQEFRKLLRRRKFPFYIVKTS